jgi:hypothetical protein
MVATRVLACMLMLPLLTLVADFSGIVMGWAANTLTEPISLRLFIHDGFKTSTFNDFLPPTLKTMVFGLIIGVVYALSLDNPFSGFSSDRAIAVIHILELPATRISRANFASARVLVSAAHNSCIRLDGEYRTAYNGL